jgi:hypothetical protein
VRLSQQSYRQTLINDKDREHPAHDAIVNLLSRPKNISKVLEDLYAFEFRREVPENRNGLELPPELSVEERWSFPQPQISHPIGHADSFGRLFPAAYLDLYLPNVSGVYLAIAQAECSAYPKQLLKESWKDKDKIGTMVYYNGYVQTYGPPWIPNFHELPGFTFGKEVAYIWQWGSVRSVAFEVKVQIKSAPEVIQQVNCYKAFLPFAKFVVVSPDDRYRDIIESQDIGFYKPSPEVIARLGLS